MSAIDPELAAHDASAASSSSSASPPAVSLEFGSLPPTIESPVGSLATTRMGLSFSATTSPPASVSAANEIDPVTGSYEYGTVFSRRPMTDDERGYVSADDTEALHAQLFGEPARMRRRTTRLESSYPAPSATTTEATRALRSTTTNATTSTPSRLETRHQMMNALFGIKPWKSHVARRTVRSPEVQQLYDDLSSDWKTSAGAAGEASPLHSPLSSVRSSASTRATSVEQSPSAASSTKLLQSQSSPVAGSPAKDSALPFSKSGGFGDGSTHLYTPGNVLWVVLFGWWLCLAYVMVAALLFLTVVAIPQGKLCLRLARYYLWPFGSFVVATAPKRSSTATMYGGIAGTKKKQQQQQHRSVVVNNNLTDDDDNGLLDRRQDDPHDFEDDTDHENAPFVVSFASESEVLFEYIWQFSARPLSEKIASLLWMILAIPLLGFAHCIALIITWMSVVYIPMAKANRIGISMLFYQPLSLSVDTHYPDPGANVVIITYQASNVFYFKYTVFGVNVVMLNLFPFVLLTLAMAYLPELLFPKIEFPPTMLFVLCSISTIPLSHYIGMSLASFSAQTTFGWGAFINATFGSIIEIILYFSAIRNGGLNGLVQASVTGTLLSLMLLIPGLSMIFGGIKFKEMRFNPASAGVSSVMLLISVVGAFMPTVFNSVYGHHSLVCEQCEAPPGGNLTCGACLWQPVSFSSDSVYNEFVVPLMFVCAILLPIAYVVGLLFTLKTHAHIVNNPEFIDPIAVAEHGPEGAEWSKLQCFLVLVGSIGLFAFIGEEMINTIEPTIEFLHISQTFAGLTILSLIPAAAEIINSIQFALSDNFALTIELCSSAAVQVALIEMPVLVVLSWLFSPANTDAFTLVFPALDLVSVVFAVIILNYISIEGVANYFTGTALVILYLLFVAAFFFVPSSELVPPVIEQVIAMTPR